MQCLKDRNIMVDLQILENEESTECKSIIKSDWVVVYQLVPPHIHHRNSAELKIRNFKANIPSILAGIAKNSHNNLWYLLIPQTELTLDILRQSNLNPNI